MSRVAPPARKTGTWPSCNETRKRRGVLMIRFDPAMTWAALPNGKRGRQPDDGDTAIQTCLAINVPFGMVPGQATGFVEGLPRRINLDRTVPGFSTFSRRQKTQKVNIAFRGSRGPLHLPIDGPGISSQNQAPEQAPESGPGITAGAASRPSFSLANSRVSAPRRGTSPVRSPNSGSGRPS